MTNDQKRKEQEEINRPWTRKEQEELDRQWKAILFRPIMTNK